MRLLISILLASLAICCAEPARTQNNLLVVSACGTLPLAYLPGAVRTATQDVNGRACGTATVTGGGDASAANQVLQIAQETAINTLLGLQADAACATDNGTCTLAALVKRLNQRLTTINTTIGTPMQATGGTVGLVAGVAEIGNVKNSGTFPVQAVLGAETTKVIGTVNQGTSPWVENISQINGVTPLMGNGATGTGSQRVTIASDNTLPTGWASSTAANQTATQAPVAPATATATKSDLVGIQYDSTQKTLTNGQQAALSASARGAAFVAVGADGFSPTLAAPAANTYVGNVNTQGTKATYRAVTLAPAIDAAGVLFQMQGSVSKTIRITKITIGGVLTVTSNGIIAVGKYTTAVSGGTSAAVTAVPLDTASAAATAVMLRWTAVGTAGTPVTGTYMGVQRTTWVADTTVNSALAVFRFGEANGQALVLRGTAEYMTVATQSFASYTGSSYTLDVEWTEE